jgi:pilus assembly protein Flp/PilA
MDYLIMKQFLDFINDTEGATAVEYALMLAAIAAVIVGAVTALGTATIDLFTDESLNTALGG